MSFNVKELIKIRKATSGSEKIIYQIAEYIKQFKLKVDILQALDIESRRKGLLILMNEESNKRKAALSAGASSYSNPKWAAPSACETYIHCLLGGNPNEIKQANLLIDELSNINREEESTKSDAVGYVVLLVGSPLAFYFLNWWTGLIVVFIGLTIIGWKSR